MLIATEELKREISARCGFKRIGAAARLNEMTYSRFMNGLNKAGIELDRKVLADIALKEPEAFAKLVAEAKDALK